jgi:hypothetical protein
VASTPHTAPHTPGPGSGSSDSHNVQLNQLVLLKELSHGGMGVVFEARDPELDRRVALKMIRDRCPDGAALERFLREARVLARLRHPHVVEIFAVGHYDGQPCYTMPLLPGSLSQLLKRGRLEPQQAAALLEKVARAIHAAHQAGVIHRDLKPGNILLDDSGEPQVADFGLAKRVRLRTDPPNTPPEEELTQTGQAVGTPSYMAPEQMDGEPATELSDIWSLGVILYEMLIGRRPFEGSGMELTQHICSSVPSSPRSLRPELSRELEAIVLRCLEKDPARRYLSAEELADDLARWQHGEPVRARPLSWSRRAGRFLARSKGRVVPALLLAAFGTALVWLLTRPTLEVKPDPVAGPSVQELQRQRALRDLTCELDAGRPVTLLDQFGQERWYRWATETDRPPLPPAMDHRTIRAVGSPCQCELLADPRTESYRFSAEVQLFEWAQNGRAGIYFLGEEQEMPNGRLYRYFSLTLAEQKTKGNLDGVVRPEGVVRFCHELYRTPNPLSAPPQGRAYLGSKILSAEELPKWHTLTIQVSPREIVGHLDNVRVPTSRPVSLDQPLETEAPGRPAPRKPMNRRGSLGLFVWKSAANFRNAVVTPLPPAEKPS